MAGTAMEYMGRASASTGAQPWHRHEAVHMNGAPEAEHEEGEPRDDERDGGAVGAELQPEDKDADRRPP